MSGTTVRFKVAFAGQRRRRGAAVPQEKPTAPDTPTDAQVPPTPKVSRIARMLALAHLIERKVDSGELKDYSEAARRLGISRSRMTHVMNLLGLPPRVQEGILTGDLAVSEKHLRTAMRVERTQRG